MITQTMNIAALALAIEILQECESYPHIEHRLHTLTEMLRVIVNKQKEIEERKGQ